MSEVAGDPIAGKSRETVTHALRMRAMFQYAGMLPVLILLCIGFAIENGRFASLTNISIVLQQAAINTVLAAGMTFVILTAGIDLSVGSILAASAMGALLVSKIHGLGMLGIVAGLAVGLGFGLINGLLIALVRLPPFIVTLGSLTAVRGMARLMGSDTTIFNANLPFAFIGNGTLFGVSWLVIIALIVVVLSWFILRRIGRHRRRHFGWHKLHRWHRIDLGHTDRRINYRDPHEWACAFRCLGYLAVHREGSRHYRCRDTRSLSAGP
jgi:ribose transport system permease protein